MYELWDLESGNLVDAFTTEAAALAAIRDAVHRQSRVDADAYALVRVVDGEPQTVLQGVELVAFALRAIAATGSP